MRARWGMLAATAAILIPVSAMAQTARDVVVMRRVIAPPQVDRDAQGYDQNTFHWETGPWTNNPSCSATAVQTRLVGCVKHREQQPDASCGTPKPDTQRTVADYSTCGFSWQVTGHGAWSSTCSANATRTTTSICTRSDGSTVADSNCASQPKPGDDTGEVTTSCTYQWKSADWSTYDNHCSATAHRTRSVTCGRSDNTTVADTSCDAASKPTTDETGSDFSQCGFSWKTGDWSVADSTCSEHATQTRDVHCERQDGTTSADASCTAAKPNATQTVASLAGCTYDWKPGDWSDYSSTCSATATRTRGVACMRTDQTVADSEARCQAGTKPALSETADVSTSCTYAWNYSAWNVVPACGDTTQSRTASCRRSDGTDGGTHCAGQTQDALSGTVYDTQTCGYSWKPGDWSNYSSTCSDAATRTRSEACVRSDNQPVDAALCAGKTHNNLSETAGVYSSCGHAWKYGAWVSASTCSNSTTQTRTATCMRTINGADVPVSDSWCSGQPKVDTQTGISDTSSCSTAWSYSSWVSTAPASTCTQNQAQTRTATCMAAIPSGGSVPVADGRCDPALKQALSQTVDVSSSCTWAWNPNDNATSTWAFGDTTTGWTGWSNTCGAATRTRTVQCVRSDGKVETGTGQSNCTASRPASTQNSTQTTDCGGNLVNGNFETGTSAGWTFDSVADTKGNKVYPFVQTNTVHSGSYSVAMPNTNQGNGAITTYLQQSFPTKAGANCSASVWMYGSNAQPTFTILNSSGVEVVSVNASSGWNQKSGSFVGNGSPFTVKIYTRGLSTSVTRVDDVVISCTP